MKTLIATVGLSIMFLSAGAFAGSKERTVAPMAAQNSNITIIEKNTEWPVFVRSSDTCSTNRCIDV